MDLISAMFAAVIEPARMAPGMDPQIECAAKTVYFEARGESILGQIQVAMVIANRMASPGFPGKPCDVVQEARKPGLYRCQFTSWCDGKREDIREPQPYVLAALIATVILQVGGVEGGITHFHGPSVNPDWSDLSPVITAGAHTFYARPAP